MRYLTTLLTIVLVLLLVGTVYVAVTPTDDSGVTELYLLNADGRAAEYPTDLAVNESATIIVGVGNQHPHDATYTVVVTFTNRTVAQYTVDLPAEGVDERAVSFSSPSPGSHRLLAALYDGKRATGKPHSSVELTVTVG